MLMRLLKQGYFSFVLGEGGARHGSKSAGTINPEASPQMTQPEPALLRRDWVCGIILLI